MMERAAELSQGVGIELRHFPSEILSPHSQTESTEPVTNEQEGDLNLEANVAKLDTRLLQQALANSSGNKAKAARLLKISERTLWYKLKKYGISSAD